MSCRIRAPHRETLEEMAGAEVAKHVEVSGKTFHRANAIELRPDLLQGPRPSARAWADFLCWVEQKRTRNFCAV